MNTASLKLFLDAGRLGEICLGMTAESIQAVIGKAADVSLRKRPEIWKFGSLQITLKRIGSEAIAAEMHLYFHSPFQLPPSVEPTDWKPSASTTLSEFASRMCEWNLPCEVEPLLSSDSQRAFRVGPSAVAIFEGSDERALLVSLHVKPWPTPFGR